MVDKFLDNRINFNNIFIFQAKDERKRMQLFKLRNTWTQYLPGKTLYDLDVKTNRFDPNWPITASTTTNGSNVNFSNTPPSITPTPQKVIHVNPKFLQVCITAEFFFSFSD